MALCEWRIAVCSMLIGLLATAACSSVGMSEADLDVLAEERALVPKGAVILGEQAEQCDPLFTVQPDCASIEFTLTGSYGSRVQALEEAAAAAGWDTNSVTDGEGGTLWELRKGLMRASALVHSPGALAACKALGPRADCADSILLQLR